MVSKNYRLALAGVVLVLSACAGCRTRSSTPAAPASAASTEAAAAPTPPNDAQRKLADALIAAVNARDPNALRKLLVPEALACYTTPEAKGYLDHWMRSHMRIAIPAGYKVSFMPYEEGFQASRLFTAPLKPSQRMEIEFDMKGQRSLLSNLVCEEKGGYYLFLPCITDAGVQSFRNEQTRRATALKNAQQVYQQLKDPLRARLVVLAKKGKTGDALQECRKELGTDFKTSGYLLDLLAGRTPDLEH